MQSETCNMSLKQVALFNFLLFLLCIFSMNILVSCSEDDHDHHGVIEKHHFIEEIHEALGISGQNDTYLTKQNLQELMTKVGFKNCTILRQVLNAECGRTRSELRKCVPLDVLLNHHGISTNSSATLNVDDTINVLSSIVYLLSYKSEDFEGRVQNYGAVCNTSLSTFPLDGNNTNAFDGLKQQHGGQGDTIITEEVLESALDTLNSTVSSLLTNKECFNIESVYKGTNVSEDDVDVHKFGLLSVYVVLKVLNKNCYEEHEHGGTSLPPKTAFIDRIFTEFATNGTMSFTNYEKLLQAVGVGGEAQTVVDNHNHNHRKKRSVVNEAIGLVNEIHEIEAQTRNRRAAVPANVLGDTCYTPESLLDIYNIDKSQGLSAAQFTELCPSIVQQIESGVCKTATTKSSGKHIEKGWKPWVSSMVAVFIISLGSLAGIFVAPSYNKPSFKLLLTFMIAIAVSTLLGDGILHLLPHSLDLHKHEESADGSHHEHDSFAKDSYLWKSLLFIAGVYMFYLFETLMHVFAPQHQHSHGLDEEHLHIGHLSENSKAKGPLELKSYTNNGGSFRRKSLVNTPAGLHECDDEEQSCSGDNCKHMVEKELEVGISNAKPLTEEPSGWRKLIIKFSKYRSVVYMILIGDAIHNFLDGIVIGVAFSEEFPAGFSGGISTSIAIFCHEVPHELGDFAVLVSCGMSIPMALGLNFLSSLTAFLGAVVGVSLGQQWDALPWVFAITAGLFAYIALADLLPELLHSSELRKKPVITIILQSLGLFFGFAIMFLLAAYEEDIKVDV